MRVLKGLIDSNADSAIAQDDEIILNFLKFSICGEYSVHDISIDKFTDFHSPAPTQYAILYNKQKSLLRILTILIDFQHENVVDVFNPVGVVSNVKYPLLHLAVITKSTKCLKIMLEYLNNLKRRKVISSEIYEDIVYLNCNFMQSEKYCRHTALYYSLKHFESFEMLCRLANADPLKETIEEDGSDSNIPDAKKSKSVFICLILSGIYHDINKFVEYFEQNHQSDLEKHRTTIKYDPNTYKVDQSGGKTLTEILESLTAFSTELSPNSKNALLLILNPSGPKPISTEDVSKNSKQLNAAVLNKNIGNYSDDTTCVHSGCDQKTMNICPKCNKRFCDEHMNHECT